MSQTCAAAVLTSWRKSQWLAGDASRCEQRFTFTLHGRGPRDTSLCRELCSTNVKGGAQLGDKVAQTRAMGSRIAQGDTAARERAQRERIAIALANLRREEEAALTSRGGGKESSERLAEPRSGTRCVDVLTTES
jgi:hypothetical protein